MARMVDLRKAAAMASQGGKVAGKVEMMAGDNERSATFVLRGEGHTLGNALRMVLMRHEDVEFCGYSIPHPMEDKMQMRLQTRSKPAMEVLREGLQTLKAAAGLIKERYVAAAERAGAKGLSEQVDFFDAGDAEEEA